MQKGRLKRGERMERKVASYTLAEGENGENTCTILKRK